MFVHLEFEEVLACLEYTEKREEFILRLKNAGQYSSPFLHVQSAIVELKMNKALRGIDEKTIPQHTFKFTDPNECFQSFRLVCKSWKDAVETIKFNRIVPPFKIFWNIDKIIKNGLSISPFFEKYLQCFKKLYAPMSLFASENRHQMLSLVLNNMQKLNSICLNYGSRSLPESVDPFILQILENSHETLQDASISRFCIPDISFSKLKTLEIVIGKDICLPEFKTYFPLVLKNMERLQTVKLSLMDPGYNDICEYIVKHYSKHCISASSAEDERYEILNIVPVKILSGVFDLRKSVQNFTYVSGLQYLQMSIYDDEDFSWDKYQESFDQCLNLKAIELTWLDEDGNGITLSQISEANQKLWQERISYFKARGICIVDDDEIWGNENLQMKLAKEAGVTWKFHFY